MNALHAQGIDIVRVDRLQKAVDRSGLRFLKRIFVDRELEMKDDPVFLATRFAAKEAFFKAIGTGVSEGVRWHDFSLPPKHDYALEPQIAGASKGFLGERKVYVSVSSTGSTAVAIVILEPLEGAG